MVPVVTGGGIAVRAAAKVDDVADAGKVARGTTKTPITSGAGRAGKTGTPSSIYEQLDDAGNLRLRTFYDERGHPFSRQARPDGLRQAAGRN